MIELDVPALKGGHCVAAVRKAVSGVDGAAACDVDLGAKRVTVHSALPPSDFVEALAEAGYAASVVRAIG